MTNETLHSAILFDSDKTGKTVICRLCSHYCNIEPGSSGLCKLRVNVNGELKTLTWGKSTGFAMDPVEKKPLYHFRPGSKVLSFGTPGCNFHCINCQNYELSQTVRNKTINWSDIHFTFPQEVAELAVKQGADGIAYTYSEPVIFFEYARDIIIASKNNYKSGSLFHIFVTNGFFTEEVFKIIEKEHLIDAMNIDLKFSESTKYKKYTGGSLGVVTDNIKRIFESGNQILTEITNLIIPGLNDSDKDIEDLCRIVTNISTDIPLHFSRFFPRFRLSHSDPTPAETLFKAGKIAQAFGIRYVYLGNLASVNNSYCPFCGTLVIERSGYKTISFFNNHKNICPKCKKELNFRL